MVALAWCVHSSGNHSLPSLWYSPTCRADHADQLLTCCTTDLGDIQSLQSTCCAANFADTSMLLQGGKVRVMLYPSRI